MMSSLNNQQVPFTSVFFGILFGEWVDCIFGVSWFCWCRVLKVDTSNGHSRSKSGNIGLSLKLGSIDGDMKCSVTTNFFVSLAILCRGSCRHTLLVIFAPVDTFIKFHLTFNFKSKVSRAVFKKQK